MTRRSGFLRLAALLVLAALGGSATAAPLRVLFIGNSYTSYNDLPGLVRSIAESADKEAPVVKASVPGGRTLRQHLAEKATLALIDQGGWNAVVLQGQSQEAALAETDEGIRTAFLAGARGLCERIRLGNPQARIIFYQTWARHAEAWRAANGRGRVGADPAEMQAWIAKWYARACDENPGSRIAPVGESWKMNYASPEPVGLHAPDHSHPSFAGSYLAALVIHRTLYQPATTEVAHRGKLGAAAALRLQGIAARIVPPATR